VITLADVWRNLTKDKAAPAPLSNVVVRGMVTDPRQVGEGSVLIVLPDRSAPELLTRAIDRGVVAVVAQSRIPVSREVTWFDTSVGPTDQAATPVGGIPGLVVPDAYRALLGLAEFWRSQLQALVMCVMGAEGLRTTQRMTRSVLSQRFKTMSPDFLCCDARSLAEALLTVQPATERLLLRVSLQDEETLAFFTRVVAPHIVAVANTFPSGSDGSGRNLWLEQCLTGGLPPATLLVLNADDALLQAWSVHTSTTTFFYGLGPQPYGTLWASEIESEGREGLRLRIHYKREVVHVRIPLLGRYSVHTALAASAIGLISDQSWDEIVAGLRTMTTQLHLILTPGYKGASFLEDSYAASPASTLSILNLLADFPERKVAVLGDMLEVADQVIEGHRKVGNRVADVASFLVTRGRLGSVMAREAIDCGMPRDAVYCASDNQDVVSKLREVIRPKDLVLVSGAGSLRLKEVVDSLVDTQAATCEV